MTRTVALVALFALVLVAAEKKEKEWTPLFKEDGDPKGFRVTAWNDVSKPAPEGAKWTVKDGILTSVQRGTWLVSDAEYGDFELELEFKIGEPGNSGIGLRFPPAGDPAFDGLELQIMGPRYRGDDFVPENERTGGIYQLFTPKENAFKPNDWNRYHVLCKGPVVRVTLNGKLIQDLNLDNEKAQPPRGKPANERPRKGHIGFQELSRGDTNVQIRSARIRTLD